MKNVLMGLLMLATLSSVAYAGDEKKSKKVKAKAEAKAEKCEKGTGTPGCCVKRVQA